MSATAVAMKLGLGGRIKSVHDFNAAVEKGLPASALERVVKELMAVAVSRAEVYDLVGSVRTLQRKRTRAAVLSPNESDRLARLARVVVRAEEVLGSAAKAGLWLTRPNKALGGEPLALLKSDQGTVAVEQVLGRIEHGIFS